MVWLHLFKKKINYFKNVELLVLSLQKFYNIKMERNFIKLTAIFSAQELFSSLCNFCSIILDFFKNFLISIRLFGKKPFDDDDKKELIKANKIGDINFDFPEFHALDENS